jgi:hypothetical protein
MKNLKPHQKQQGKMNIDYMQIQKTPAPVTQLRLEGSIRILALLN